MAPNKHTLNGAGVSEANLEEVDLDIKSLVEQSITARKRAYCPYSKFAVGAALLFKDGTVVQGCNVENISLGVTICAERTAMVKAVSEGQTELVAAAICAVMNNQPVSPCGACRQFLSEFNPQAKIYLHNCGTEKVVLTSLSHLLPMSLDDLKVQICMS